MMSTTIKTLTEGDVMQIRSRLACTLVGAIDAFGQVEPIHPERLSSAVDRQTAGFAGKRKYTTVQEIGATLFYGIAMNHAFENGNKRTALVTLLVFLNRNKRIVVNTDESELFDLVAKTAAHELPISSPASNRSEDEVRYLASWLREKTRTIELGDRSVEFPELRRLLLELGCEFEKPLKNFIKIRRGRQSSRIGYPRDRFTVSVPDIKKLRRDLGLDEVHGIDSGAFYDLDARVDSFVNQYRNLLRRLADL